MKVFLSHSGYDKTIARRIAERIQQASHSVWLDEAEINIGESLLEAIGFAIRDCDFVIALISIHSVDSAWVRKELLLAMTKEIEGRTLSVLPVVLDHECKPYIPFYLTDKLYADLSPPSAFDEQIDRILKVLRAGPHANNALQTTTLPTSVGEAIQNRGEQLVAYKQMRIARTNGVKFLLLGLPLIVAGPLGRSIIRGDRGATTALFLLMTAGALLFFSGLALLSYGQWLQRAIDLDKNILVRLEAIGEEPWGIFTPKLVDWWELGTTNRPYRIALVFCIASMTTMIIGTLVAAFSVFVLATAAR